MSHYEIYANTILMGVYEGDTPHDALNAYARDAGYDSFIDVVRQFGEDDTVVCRPYIPPKELH